MMDQLAVNEIFQSLQGEGAWAGVPSVFVRLAGCHLRCRWCDTPYAWESGSGSPMTIEAIVTAVQAGGCRHVVITGGEPLLQEAVAPLTGALRACGCHITIETAAPRHVPVACDLMSISPKLGNSGAVRPDARYPALNRDALRIYLGGPHQLKFVCGGERDLGEILDFLAGIGDYNRDLTGLMPQARTRDEYRRIAPVVAALCVQNNLRFWPRLHIELWGGQRGK